MPASPDEQDRYSQWMGMVYVFNLIVGTGALTLPAAFAQSGWILGLALIAMLSFMSFLTATFVIETMASANAIIHWRRHRQRKKQRDSMLAASSLQQSSATLVTDEEEASASSLPQAVMQRDELTSVSESPSLCAGVVVRSGSSLQATPGGETDDLDDESRQLLDPDSPSLNEYYSIMETVEMGKMASFFFSKAGINVFYILITLYLYGDLAIYAAAVAKSLRDVGCTYVPANHTCNETIASSERCWHSSSLTRWDAYRLFLVSFVLSLGTFVFFNVQKTKYLQVFTSLMRWTAFSLMVVLAVRKLILTDPHHRLSPPSVSVSGLPTLFGVCVYSFMCHHSLPSLITPINNKRHLNKLLIGDYMLINCFYLLLALTGIFAFPHVYDLYTLNFLPAECRGHSTGWFELVLDYFLTLFPVFTLSTNFPVIAITLRNNLHTLCLSEGRRHGLFVRRILFPVLALLPPSIVALVFQDLKQLVGVTGSYAGSGVQYVVPALLVHYSRRTTLTLIGMGVQNKHRSWFQHPGWVLFVLVWAAVCVAFVTTNHLQEWLQQ